MEEREEECGLIVIVGTPFSRRLKKEKQNNRERRADHLYITEKSNDCTLGGANKAGSLLRKIAVDLDLV